MSGTKRRYGNCNSCNERDGYDDMVCCDRCDEWHHYVCAGVGPSIRSIHWFCQKCLTIFTVRNRLQPNSDWLKIPCTVLESKFHTYQQAKAAEDSIARNLELRKRTGTATQRFAIVCARNETAADKTYVSVEDENSSCGETTVSIGDAVRVRNETTVDVCVEAGNSSSGETTVSIADTAVRVRNETDAVETLNCAGNETDRLKNGEFDELISKKVEIAMTRYFKGTYQAKDVAIRNVQKKRAVQSSTDDVIESCVNESVVSEGAGVNEESGVGEESGERENILSESVVIDSSVGESVLSNVSDSGVSELSESVVTEIDVDEAIATRSVTSRISTPIRADQGDRMLAMFNSELCKNYEHAAKVKAVLLNSMLLTGPDELASLVDILRRFREQLFSVGGDIKEMFHQVKMRKKDQRYQLFLFRDGEINRKPDIYSIDVMVFGSKCSPAAAQFVKNTNAKKFQRTHPKAVDTIINNHYVDDMMDGENTIEETIKMVNDVKTIHASGGFEIRNFISNSAEVLKGIRSTDTCENKELSLNSELKTERVLGMWWNTKLDVFTFSLKYTVIAKDILNGTKLPTKRELLRTLMSIFDPLGLLSNYLIHLKILLQDVWRMDLNWDFFTLLLYMRY